MGESGLELGTVLKNSANPIYISIGHKISLPSAVNFTIACCVGKGDTTHMEETVDSRVFCLRCPFFRPELPVALWRCFLKDTH